MQVPEDTGTRVGTNLKRQKALEWRRGLPRLMVGDSRASVCGGRLDIRVS